MPTSYTSLLGFALPATGELSGTWGTTVNNSITELVEDAIAATATASVAGGDWTLSTTGSGSANEARCAILIPTGSPGVSRNIIAPSQSKAYIVLNQSDAAVVVKGAATTGATLVAGEKAVVAWNGSDFVTVASSVFSGTVPVASGGTGQTTYTNGQLLIGNTTGNTLTKATLTAGSGVTITNGTGSITIAATGSGGTVTSVSTSGTVNGITLTGGPITGSGTITLGGTLSGVNLTSQVTGTLPVGNGGTGGTTFTANNVLLGNGTSAFQVVAPGTSGNVLASNGTTWTSTTPSAGSVGTLQYFLGGATATYPGSAWVLCNGSIVSQSTYSDLFNRIGLFYDGTLTNVTSASYDSGSDLTYGSGSTFVASSFNSSNNIGYSTNNGASWTFVTAFNSGVRGVGFGNGVYLAVGGSGKISTSTDAISWTARTSGTASELNKVAYGGGKYVAGGANTVITTSTDGITWSASTPLGGLGAINTLQYANNRFLGYTQNGNLFSSTDAITWTTLTRASTTHVITGFAYGNNRYVYVGLGTSSVGICAYSTDAITWTSGTMASGTYPRSVNYVSNYGFVSYVGGLAVSTNGEVFNSITTNTSISNEVETAYGNGYLVTNVDSAADFYYNKIFTYNISTEFKLPTSGTTSTTIATQGFAGPPTLYIKAFN